MSNIKPFMPIIENIYFSAIPTGNFDYRKMFNERIEHMMVKLKSQSYSQDVFLFEGCEVLSSGIGRYPFGFYSEEKCRVYFAPNWTDNYPIYIIVSAQFLHTCKVKDVLNYCSSLVKRILEYFVGELNVGFLYKLSRIDICNHTTKIDMDYIKLDEYFSRVSTRLNKVFPVIERAGEGKQEVPYIRYGKGDFCVRFYNKTKEVCEQKYKPFFIKKWYDEKLIDEKTFHIYETCYNLGGNYRASFLFANIVHSDIDVKELVEIVQVFNDVFKPASEKIDVLLKFIKDKKIKLCKEIINCEFQLRSNWLKTVKIADTDTGEYFDFTNMNVLFENADILYHYITKNLFVVKDRKSKAYRIRDKLTDKIWLDVQNCNIENIDSSVKIKNADIYRRYNENMNKFLSTKTSVQNLVHLYYVCSDDINFKSVDNISIDEICKNVKSECALNENYFNIQYMLSKQLKNYGQKGVSECVEKQLKDEFKKSQVDNFNEEYVRNFINELKFKRG